MLMAGGAVFSSFKPGSAIFIRSRNYSHKKREQSKRERKEKKTEITIIALN